MDNPSWGFVLATVISVIGIAIIYRQLALSVERKALNDATNSIQKELSHFFIKVGIVETIPLLLIINGFMILDSFQSSLTEPELFIPLGIVIIVFILGFIMINSTTNQLQQMPNINENIKRSFLQFKQISLGLISAFPIISVVAIIIMGG